MTAVFAMTIAISCKGSAASWTGVFINSIPFDKVHVAVPPAVSASVRAELFLFPAFELDHRFAAVGAKTVGSGHRGSFYRHALDL